MDGILEKLKAGLVAKGFEQAEGVEYNEAFSHMVKWTKIRTIVAMASKKGWKIKHLDMKTTILNGDLDVEVFMEIPQRVEVENQRNKVVRLMKTLYGLTQASRAWYSKIDQFL